MDKEYPEHIYDKVRQEVAVSYLKHELRKLFLSAPKTYWKMLDRDIENWIDSPVLANPRDFWNGFYGICMGFKLNIGLIYFVTAENIVWNKEIIPINKLIFGASIPELSIMGEGKITVPEAMEFYNKPANKNLKTKWMESLRIVRGGKSFDKGDPIIVVQKYADEKTVDSIYDGHNRVAKIMFEGGGKVYAYIGRYTSGIAPQNYWIPTTILMELILFAKQAYDREDVEMLLKYIEVLKDIIKKSESAKYELKERSLTGSQEFKNTVIEKMGM